MSGGLLIAIPEGASLTGSIGVFVTSPLVNAVRALLMDMTSCTSHTGGYSGLYPFCSLAARGTGAGNKKSTGGVLPMGRHHA